MNDTNLLIDRIHLLATTDAEGGPDKAVVLYDLTSLLRASLRLDALPDRERLVKLSEVVERLVIDFWL